MDWHQSDFLEFQQYLLIALGDHINEKPTYSAPFVMERELDLAVSHNASIAKRYRQGLFPTGFGEIKMT